MRKGKCVRKHSRSYLPTPQITYQKHEDVFVFVMRLHLLQHCTLTYCESKVEAGAAEQIDADTELSPVHCFKRCLEVSFWLS
jgi:hypothetical protein